MYQEKGSQSHSLAASLLSRFEPCSIHTSSNRISTDAMLALFHFAVFRDSKGIKFFGSHLFELRIGSIAPLEKS